MSLIIAVSGGIDSVVLLDMISKSVSEEVIVAHVDHGIREDSWEDAKFVKDLAEKYGYKFELLEANLGSDASEDQARRVRYDFFDKLAEKYEATILTAHHGDDVIETVVLNIQRGTRWRGLAVMGNSKIRRPLTRFFKEDLEDYASWNHLRWREDSTNSSDKYSRNKVRMALKDKISKSEKLKIIELWSDQNKLKAEIEAEIGEFASVEVDRYWYSMVDFMVAEEVLYSTVLDKFGISLLSEQLTRGVLAIRTLLPGKKIQLGEGVEFFSTNDGGKLVFIESKYSNL